MVLKWGIETLKRSVRQFQGVFEQIWNHSYIFYYSNIFPSLQFSKIGSNFCTIHYIWNIKLLKHFLPLDFFKSTDFNMIQISLFLLDHQRSVRFRVVMISILYNDSTNQNQLYDQVVGDKKADFHIHISVSPSISHDRTLIASDSFSSSVFISFEI